MAAWSGSGSSRPIERRAPRRSLAPVRGPLTAGGLPTDQRLPTKLVHGSRQTTDRPLEHQEDEARADRQRADGAEKLHQRHLLEWSIGSPHSALNLSAFSMSLRNSKARLKVNYKNLLQGTQYLRR